MIATWKRLLFRYRIWRNAHPWLFSWVQSFVWLALFDLVTKIFGWLFPTWYGAIDRRVRAGLPTFFLASGIILIVTLVVLTIKELLGQKTIKVKSTRSTIDRIFLIVVVFLGGAGICFLDAYFAASDQTTERTDR